MPYFFSQFELCPSQSQQSADCVKVSQFPFPSLSPSPPFHHPHHFTIPTISPFHHFTISPFHHFTISPSAVAPQTRKKGLRLPRARKAAKFLRTFSITWTKSTETKTTSKTKEPFLSRLIPTISNSYRNSASPWITPCWPNMISG